MIETAIVERVIKSHVGESRIVHLKMGEKIQCYRVSEEEYEAAGAPSAGDEVFGEELAVLTRRENAKRAYERALKILAAGDNTRKNLKRKLRERGFGEEESEYAVSRLAEEGYLKEEDMLLRQFAVFRKRMWGPGKFMPSLISKGFSREMIRRVAERAVEEDIYCAEDVRAALLAKNEPKDEAERRALLYKYGFRP